MFGNYWKMLLFVVAPLLESVSAILKNKDADDIGPDDKAAQFLHYAAVAVAAIRDEQPLPTMPASLKSQF